METPDIVARAPRRGISRSFIHRLWIKLWINTLIGCKSYFYSLQL